MGETNNESVDSTNNEDQANLENTEVIDEKVEDAIVEDLESENDPVVLKERLVKLANTNKQLFNRTKKAEGFEMKDGVWTKKATPTEIKPNTPAPKKDEGDDVDLRISKGITSALEQRDLDSFGLSDELKTEVSNLARLKNITVKEAMKSDYVKFQIEKEQQADTTDSASLPSGRKGTFTKVDTVVTADPRTEEGKKVIAKRDAELRKRLG